MAITEDSSDGGTNLAAVTPTAAISEGLMIYVACVFSSQSSGSYPTSWTPPTGFAELALENAGFNEIRVWRKEAGASEPSSYDFSSYSGASIYGSKTLILSYDGVDDADPDGTPVTFADTNSPLNIPALTTDNANSLDIVFCSDAGNYLSNSFTSWTNSFVEQYDSAFDYCALGMANVIRTSAGAQGTATVNQVNSDGGPIIRFEINEASAGSGADLHPLTLLGVG